MRNDEWKQWLCLTPSTANRWVDSLCNNLYPHGPIRVTDRVSAKVRSKIMASVGTKNTSPEMAVRSLLHAAGYRFRIHQKDLPGRPDLVFRSRRAIVFVHGCFWHGHGCSKGKLPKSKLGYWSPKIVQNRSRDTKTARKLRSQGWRVLVIWQCELRNIEKLKGRAMRFLDDPKNSQADKK